MRHENNPSTSSFSGETPYGSQPELRIIPDDILQVSWETNTTIPTANVNEAWERVRHMGIVGGEEAGGESGAGWGIPARFNRFLPKSLQSTPTLEDARPMAVGTRLRDVPKDSYVVTREVDDENRSILWESDWPEKNPGEEPLHYTYRLTLEPGSEAGTTNIKTGLRATNVGHPQLMAKAGPMLDAQAMKLFGEGLIELIDPEQAKAMQKERTKRRIGFAVAVSAGLVVWKLSRNK